ncbi:hypothetical protein BG004_003375 [Podila humilis]|nr:hypothetical protein BG004_003375 [Podila humilis]
MSALQQDPEDLQGAEDSACKHVVAALHNVKDPMVLLQYLKQGNDTLEFSSRLVHRWPSNEKQSRYRLEWASNSIRENIADQLKDDSKRKILRTLIDDPDGSAGGLIFGVYVLRVFKEGGHCFVLKDLETGELTRLEIPLKPVVNRFYTIVESEPNQLWIPYAINFPCVDFLFSPKDLFQVTVSKTHPIEGHPLSELVNNIRDHHWIEQHVQPRLIFVVPEHTFHDFPLQNYHATTGKNYAKESLIPANIRSLKQYAMKIDLASAAAGESPGTDPA